MATSPVRSGGGRGGGGEEEEEAATPPPYSYLPPRPTGYEAQLGTPTGRRAVAKHNSCLRLATLRHGMLDAIQRPPVGFERPVLAHFFYKRDEIIAQAAMWVAEAVALARHEVTLSLAVLEEGNTRAAAALAKVKPVEAAEAAAQAAQAAVAAKAAADAAEAAHQAAMASAKSAYARKRLATEHRRNSAYLAAAGGVSGAPSAIAAALRSAYSSAGSTGAYMRWLSETAVSSHAVFVSGGGVGPTPPFPARAPAAAAASASLLSRAQASLAALEARRSTLEAARAAHVAAAAKLIADASGKTGAALAATTLSETSSLMSACAFAASQSGGYGGGGGVPCMQLALCMAEAADRVAAALKGLAPPAAAAVEEEVF